MTQLDDASWLANDLADKLKEQREQRREVERQLSEALAKSAASDASLKEERARCAKLERELARAKTQLALRSKSSPAASQAANQAGEARGRPTEGHAAGSAHERDLSGGYIVDGLVYDANGRTVVDAFGAPLKAQHGNGGGGGGGGGGGSGGDGGGHDGGGSGSSRGSLSLGGGQGSSTSGMLSSHEEHSARLAVAVEEAAVAEARILELQRRQASGKLTANEQAELHMLNTRLLELHETLASESRASPAGVIFYSGGKQTELEADGNPIVTGSGPGSGSDGASMGVGAASSAEHSRATQAAEMDLEWLQRRKASGELTVEEEAELQKRLDARQRGLDDDAVCSQGSGTAACTDEGSGASSLTAPGRVSKKARTSEIVPAGRLVTLTRIRATDVPDVDLRGGEKNVSDPYITFHLLDASGARVDEGKTDHLENQRHPKWMDTTVRLFMPDHEPPKGKTPPLKLLVTLMDWNKKSDHKIIGEVEVPLPVGAGKVKVEVPSRCVSMSRPFVYLQYDAAPQMFFEQVEWVRVEAENAAQPMMED